MVTYKDKNIFEDIITFGYDAVLVPMSVYNSMNRGFAYDIALNFPEVKEGEKLTPYGDERKYGTFCEVNTSFLKFIICYIHNGGFTRKENDAWVDYEYLTNVLNKINEKFKGKRIASPLMGASRFDGNGNADKIKAIFDTCCKDIDISVYLYEQKDSKYEAYCNICELCDKANKGEITKKEYEEQRNKIEWERRYGIFKPMPEDYNWRKKKNVYLQQ